MTHRGKMEECIYTTCHHHSLSGVDWVQNSYSDSNLTTF